MTINSSPAWHTVSAIPAIQDAELSTVCVLFTPRADSHRKPCQHPVKHPANTVSTPCQHPVSTLSAPFQTPCQTPCQHPANALLIPYQHPVNTPSTSCQLLERHSRLGDKLTLIPSHLSPKRDCGSKRVNTLQTPCQHPANTLSTPCVDTCSGM